MAKKIIYKIPKRVVPKAIIIWCGDPRLQEAIPAFIRDRLKLKAGSYIPFVVDGGPGPIGQHNEFREEFKFMHDRLIRFLDHYSTIKRVIIISHQDCAYYKSISSKMGSLFPLHVHMERNDIKQIRSVFDVYFRKYDIKLETYYASFIDMPHAGITIEKSY